MKYIITHKKYGERAKYTSLTAAQEAIQAKGPEFEDTELAESPDGLIMDEFDEVVGRVEEDEF